MGGATVHEHGVAIYKPVITRWRDGRLSPAGNTGLCTRPRFHASLPHPRITTATRASDRTGLEEQLVMYHFRLKQTLCFSVLILFLTVISGIFLYTVFYSSNRKKTSV